MNKSHFRGGGEGLFCGKGNKMFVTLTIRFSNVDVLYQLVFLLLDLDYGHIIPYFGFLYFHPMSSSSPGDPAGIYRPFRHLKDKLVFIKNQPIVYKEGARKVKVVTFLSCMLNASISWKVINPNVPFNVISICQF